MNVLFVGGTGIISSACVPLALQRGIQVTLLNRGLSQRLAPDGVEVLTADVRDESATRAALGSRHFDAVVDWIAFTPEHIETDLRLFRDRADQFVFISSASAYQTPPAVLPVTETTPLDNPFWQYSRDKIACENRLMGSYRQDGFPVTIVRPSHTYDRRTLPFTGGYTVVDRMRRRKPVIVHGDGTSIWVLTHHRDFAVGLVGLLGRPEAIGEAFHITSSELLTWNQIFRQVAEAAGTVPHLVHLPSEWIAARDPAWGAGLLGDKAHSMIFDNSKIRSLVPEFAPGIPFAQGASEILEWFDADPARRTVDAGLDGRMDRMLVEFGL